jgi:hypothetical protein
MAALPTVDAPHTCLATEPTPHDRYVGQWTVHGCHDVALTFGGTMHCPGKTNETVLGKSS